MIYYAQSTGGFYDSAVHGTAIPPDAVQITAAERDRALDAQASGKTISGVDSNGNMVLSDPPAPTLDELKLAKAADMTAACLAAIDSGFDYDGHRFDSDLVSRTNIIGTATGVQAGIALPQGFTWRTSDNENVPMDGDGVIALGAALLQHVNQQYATSWQLKAQIEAATTPEDIAAISWPSTP
ncbi:DUF4376 domain-containing protein [Bordetella bronchialis]|uniref:DUF4376 domain-containing protein n=1 Tax=Bordetella bronchialis TaxID=463025 RepID=A0A193FV97_9BORD|nr:DUF4376 domain-containing protein [Bordetella bronchialis]ANN71560.1 hypothetical protein BAU08_09605 [Bordetella bronchialis]